MSHRFDKIVFVCGLFFVFQFMGLGCSAKNVKSSRENEALLSGGIPAGWPLVWSEEFSKEGLPDPKVWTFDTSRNLQGWYNEERQYYSSERVENAVVKQGNLVITARKESMNTLPDWGGQLYTSARLMTKDKAQWTYGFYEVRAKLPCGSGTWPAIWMLGRGGQWPLDGELDIMEHSGPNEGVILGTVHNSKYSGATADSGQIKIKDVCGSFHRYQMSWNQERVVFGVDDENYHQYINSHKGFEEWPYDQPFYFILNVAIGGTLGGTVNDSIFPVTMEVDYIRVYQGQ